MFLHIGENIAILKKDIIAIIDKDSLDNSKEVKNAIQNLIDNDYLVNKNIEDIKTYIITCIEKKPRRNRKYKKEYALYGSSVSSTTLFKRNKDIENRLEVLINGQ